MKLNLRVSRVLLGSAGESVLVHLFFSWYRAAVCLQVGPVRAAIPIICQLVRADP